jgi:hypothetical protein
LYDGSARAFVPTMKANKVRLSPAEAEALLASSA